MAFELVGITTSEAIHETDTLLSDVARILQLSLPLLERLDEKLYDSPRFSAADAGKLFEEVTQLAQRLVERPAGRTSGHGGVPTRLSVADDEQPTGLERDGGKD